VFLTVLLASLMVLSSNYSCWENCMKLPGLIQGHSLIKPSKYATVDPEQYYCDKIEEICW